MFLTRSQCHWNHTSTAYLSVRNGPKKQIIPGPQTFLRLAVPSASFYVTEPREPSIHDPDPPVVHNIVNPYKKQSIPLAPAFPTTSRVAHTRPSPTNAVGNNKSKSGHKNQDEPLIPNIKSHSRITRRPPDRYTPRDLQSAKDGTNWGLRHPNTYPSTTSGKYEDILRDKKRDTEDFAKSKTPALLEEHITSHDRLEKRRSKRRDRDKISQPDPHVEASYEAALAKQQHHSTKPSSTVRNRRPRQIKALHNVFIPKMISVANLARLLGIRIDSLQRTMINSGMSEASSYDHLLMADDSSLLAMELGFNPVVDDEAAFDIHPPSPHPNPHLLPLRSPIVTIMGHVDHGKTTLLDTLRSSSVAKGEVGGITQHIGAFSVPVNVSPGSESALHSITFLDTPGHAAFSTMRARGVRVTDVIVLVVAADDGVMPQTREVVNLIKAERNIGVVVAINKVDKPGVDVDRVQKELLSEGLELEAFGGDIPCVQVSGLSGSGLGTLVETISVMAEMLELRCETDSRAHGFLIESRIQKGLGPVATLIIQKGTLRIHSHIISGLTSARVRQMTDASGNIIKVAYPGMAVTVSGWKELPTSVDEFIQADESDIKKALTNRIRRADLASLVQDAQMINEQRQVDRKKKEVQAFMTSQSKESAISTDINDLEPSVKELCLVVKGDVTGSVEAVVGALQGIGNHLARVKILHSGVGDVSESDVMRAKTANGAIVAFTVRIPRDVGAFAASNGVPLIESSVIYRLMEDVHEKVVALLPVTVEKKVSGEANILQLFDIQMKRKQTKAIAGCRARYGTIPKAQDIRVLRNGVNIYEGPVDTLRHHKSDILEVSREMDFGISLQKFEDLRIGDLLQSIQKVELPGKL